MAKRPALKPKPQPHGGEFGAALAVLLARLIYAATLAPHAFEDAYINFRCARHWLMTGHPFYNLGERVMSVTSALWLIVVTPFVGAFGDPSLPLLLLNSGLDCVTAVIVMRRLQGPARWAWIVALCTIPPLVRTAGFGLETNLLMCAAALAATSGRWRLVGLAVLAAVRPEGPIYAGVLALALPGRRAALGAVAAGVAIQAGLNLAIWGVVIPDTVRSKALVHGVHPFASWVWLDWLLPSTNTYLPGFLGLGLLKPLLVPAAAWRARWESPLTALALSALAVMAAYSVTGTTAMFEWYATPLLVLALPSLVDGGAALLERIGSRRLSWAAGIMAVGCLAGAWPRFVFHESRRIGMESQYFRVDRELEPKPGETVLLEPAGIMPWRWDARVIDEVGLVTPEVARDRHDHGSGWYARILERDRPEWLVARYSVLMQNEPLGGNGNPFTSQGQRDSALAAYALVKTFDAPETANPERGTFILLRRKP